MAIEPKKKRSANPVTALSNGLEEDLQRQGYGVGTIWKQRRLFNDLLIWLESQQLAMADLTVAKVDLFMADRRAAGVRKLKTRKVQSTGCHSGLSAWVGAGTIRRKPR